ncbi:hypothetical protein CI105_08290 [Candidatus Izimaplasma bacterium ZiA1]|uniref:hypothetical protein n=1 Tax=Candidatus Izimoplasma sp. ZiA1 TaxID=2024899 RepID=UPI000BAA840D|nr:hypothetical protein CI105_08290 [Candidatus Izimaplasma bacterium ZiA1]
MDNPILLAATAFALVFIPLLSFRMSKIRLWYIFILPILAMMISFPMFFLLVVIPTMPNAKTMFIITMSLWTGGFFGIFISFIAYLVKKRNSQISKYK